MARQKFCNLTWRVAVEYPEYGVMCVCAGRVKEGGGSLRENRSRETFSFLGNDKKKAISNKKKNTIKDIVKTIQNS